MSGFKSSRIGRYGPLERSLQRSLSFESCSLSKHEINVYRLLGDASQAEPTISDIGSALWMETPDRTYDTDPVLINAWYDTPMQDEALSLERFGIMSPLQGVLIVKIHINSFEADGMGRYIITGDIIEIPALEMNGKKAFFTVDDVDKRTVNENYHVVCTCNPIRDSQETAEIPNIPTDSDALDALQAQFDADYAKNVTYAGVDSEFDLYVARDYVVDDYFDPIDAVTYTNETTKVQFDPRPDRAESFLDDPNAQVF